VQVFKAASSRALFEPQVRYCALTRRVCDYETDKDCFFASVRTERWLVVIANIAIVAVMLLPALGHDRLNTRDQASNTPVFVDLVSA